MLRFYLYLLLTVSAGYFYSVKASASLGQARKDSIEVESDFNLNKDKYIKFVEASLTNKEEDPLTKDNAGEKGRTFSLGEHSSFTDEELSIIEKKANDGSMEAQFVLGVYSLTEHKGRSKNLKEAFRWIKKSADGGFLLAKAELARMYLQGLGVPKSVKDAIPFLKDAVNGNVLSAKLNLGELYLKGLGVVKDVDKGLKYITDSAESGYDLARQFLGEIYLTGSLDVKKDYTKAFKWLEISALDDSVKSMYNLALMYYNGWGVEKNLLKATAWMGLADFKTKFKDRPREAFLKFIKDQSKEQIKSAQNYANKLENIIKNRKK